MATTTGSPETTTTAAGRSPFVLGLTPGDVRAELGGAASIAYDLDPTPYPWGYPVAHRDSDYTTSVGVRIEGDQVRITRHGKGEVLRFDLSASRQRMAPVRAGGRGGPVACIGGQRGEVVSICSPDWYLDRARADTAGPAWSQSLPTLLDACVALARALII